MTHPELERDLSMYYGEIIYVFDTETGNILFANDKASEFYGYSVETLKRMNIADINQLKADDLRQEITRAANREKNFFVFPHRLSSGEIRTVEVTSWPVEVDGKTLLFSTVHDITERKKIENEYMKSLVRLSKGELMANLGSWEFNYVTGKVYASEGSKNIYGLTGEEWEISLFENMPLPAYREEVAQRKRDLVTKGTPYDVIFPVRRVNDNELRYIRSIAEYDADTQVIYGVMQDITDAILSEEAMKNRTNLFITILSVSALGLLSTTLLLANTIRQRKKYERDLLQSKERITLQNNDLFEAVEELNATNEELNASNEALADSFKEIEEKNASLERATRNFNALVEQTGAITFEMSKEGLITSLNNSSSLFAGYTPEEIIGKKYFYDLHPEETRETFKEANIAYLREGKSVTNFDNPIVTKDGKTVWLLTSVFPVFNENNQLTGYRGIDINITERKSLENALLKAKEEAESALKAKSSFLSNMSHEIRTPMNAIMGYTQLLLEKEKDAEKHKMLLQIQSSNHYLLNLINDILDLSKIEEDKLKLHFEDFNIQEMLKRVEGNFSHLAREKGLVLSVRIDEKMVPYIRSDELRMEQILNNLLGNAVKFTESGSIALEVACNNPEDDAYTNRLSFKITDTGIGISPEAMPRIFEKFEQAEYFLTKKFGGTGLGLTIVKNLVDRFSGTLSVSSTVGKGTTMTVEIPVLTVSIPIKENPESERHTPLPKNVHRVLIAEDNEITQSLMKKVFNRNGIDVAIVENGLEVCQKLEEGSFDLVLMDIQMPVLNGIDATLRIRKEERFKNLPIIAFSAYIDKEIEKTALESGMNGFITKPVTPENLMWLINTFISKENSAKN
jgi:PAS domain S-box-containing protein